MLWFTTFVLAGSALAASTLTGKTMRRRKSACRTWLAASQRERDRGKRTPGSLLFDGLQKTFEPLFGQTHSRPLRARRAGAGVEATSALEQTAYRELGLSLLTLVGAAVGVVLYSPVLLLTTPVVVYLWRDAFTGAYRALRKDHRVTVDVLYVFTMILAITSGYFFLLAFVAAVYCGSHVLLLNTQEHVRSNVARTFGLDQRQVWLVQAEVEVAMPLAQVAVGDLVVVHAGDPIPVDGYVTEGTAFVDQHMLTGEAQPVAKTPGDYVLATTVLRTGKLYIRVDKTGRETTAGHLVDLLRQTVDSRASVGSRGHVLAERLAVPVLLLGGLALLTGGSTSAMAVLNATLFMSLLTVGPLCLLTGLQRTAQHHMFVKDGRALEQLAHVDTVVFDKTGTLTRAQPSAELQATIRSEAQRVIAQLRRCGITTFCLISGDHETPTQRLAQAVGVDRYFVDTLPQDKAGIIKQLQAQGHVVCYVGDRVNEALACQQAQVAVSLRGASTAVTDTAHVVMLDEGLGRLGDLFAIAADCNKTLTTSFVLAIVPGGINIVGAFFLHFGFLYSVLCSQAGLWASVGNALWPLHEEQPQQSQEHQLIENMVGYHGIAPSQRW